MITLSKRKREVLLLLAGGHTNKTIAKALGLSVHSIKFHMDELLLMFDARSRAHLVVLAMAHGCLQTEIAFAAATQNAMEPVERKAVARQARSKDFKFKLPESSFES